MLPIAQIRAQTANLELGLGYNSEDAYRLGQYTGITEQGSYTVAGFNTSNMDSAPGGNSKWFLHAKDLGLETAEMQGGWSWRNDIKVELDFSQLPHYRFNDGRSPFLGSGSSVQSLPGSWVGGETTSELTSVGSSLRSVNIDKLRKRLIGAVGWQVVQGWRVDTDFRHEIKQGNETLGAIFGSTGGNPRGSLLSRPIDYETSEVGVNLNYASQISQLNVGYSLSRFQNDNKALRFSNPFDNPEWASGAGFSDDGVGQIALEPDNRAARFSISGAHTLAGHIRLNGNFVSTTLEQDDRFLPYSSIFTGAIGLPAMDLDGKVGVIDANLKLSGRLGRRTLLVVRYNYRDRDNETKQNNYARIPGDAALQSPLVSDATRVNRIYDFERSRAAAELSHRFSSRTRLTAGYENEETDRTMVDVATTSEDTAFLKLDLRPSATSSAWIKVTRAERDASSYDSTVPFVSGHNPDYVATLVGNELFENDPLLRRYHLADRERDEVSATLSYFPLDEFGLTLLGKTSSNDYPGSVLGITRSRNKNYAVDLAFSPDRPWHASVYMNYDNFENRNRGYTRLGFPFNTPFYPEQLRIDGLNWSVDTEDSVYSYGGGIDWDLLGGRLDLSTDISFTDATTVTRPRSFGNVALPIPGVTTDTPFADVTTTITNFTLRASYQLRQGHEVRFRYSYEDFESEDWAFDAVEAASVANMLLLGNESPIYSGHIVALSLVFEI